MGTSKHDTPSIDELAIEQNASLQPHNTLAVPVSARYLCQADSVLKLQQCLAFVKAHQCPLLVLGEGSNTVFTQNFDGLVILNRLRGIEVLKNHQQTITVRVAAGENWHSFVKASLERNWYGLENLALIPGLVGAAPIQNIGAYGVEVKDLIAEVHCIDCDNFEIKSLSNQACQFEYRDSVFKQHLNGKVIITHVDFCLSKMPTAQLVYPALADNFKDNPTPSEIFNRVCTVRQAKLPAPKDIPNAGSFFKNPVVNQEKFDALINAHPDMVGYKVDGGVKLAAAWLIEHRGWKEKEVQGVKVHERQSLVVINPKRKSGKDILKLADAIQQDILNAFGVHLEIEPRIY